MAFDPMRLPMTFVTARARLPRPGTAAFRAFNAFTNLNVRLYRLTGGRVSGHLANASLLLLHHRGRKSGEHRVNPLVYIPDGRDLVIVASMGGAPKSPAWFLNLKAAPDTEVEVGSERRSVTARIATSAERERLWPLLDAAYPPFAEYRERTDREIPIVVLSPRG